MPRSACFPLLGWKPGNIRFSSGSTIQCHRLLLLLLRRKSKSIIDYWQSFNNNNNVIIFEWNLPNTRLNQLAPLWMFAARLETWKNFCLYLGFIFIFGRPVGNLEKLLFLYYLYLYLWPPGWKPGKDLVFVSLSSQEHHLGSPCLGFLDYQAQISIPVIRVFSKHCLHVFTVFLLKLNALQSSDANPFDQPGCAEKLLILYPS